MNLQEITLHWEKVAMAAFSMPPTLAAITGIIFAALLYGLHHAADAVVRRQLCAPNLLVFAGLLGIILFLIGWIALLDLLWPGVGENPLVETAAVGGLIVGKNLPRRDQQYRSSDDD